ncbi:unnamed protein product (macronuclear) [Paramecium tetraurelia]|uniref:C2H2-type domain-containing protein n=1 Tax=Paramecium tetraurelia TaxID=5888 RepID=A0BWH7_PARTE|nr:uncharacterized protein GSPATT00032746001 [Paramecium tetraurelia]CAK62894.1 unnamed protein product [Paramecium tetraurelia]|eukprot:XP_001430292.1 hypothetical protein (macronuclear) [Paramecium tetraurelia strain d4-2]
MLNKSIKVTKKVIIINQKTGTISENTSIINREPLKNGIEVERSDQKNSNQRLITNELGEQKCDLRQLQEMLNIYLKNNQKIKEIKSIVDALKNRTNKLEQQLKQQEMKYKEKRVRRTSTQIEKKYKCYGKNCDKSYGSMVSLNLHMRIKHKRQRNVQEQQK